MRQYGKQTPELELKISNHDKKGRKCNKGSKSSVRFKMKQDTKHEKEEAIT